MTLKQTPIFLTITLMDPKFAGNWVTNLLTYSCTWLLHFSLWLLCFQKKF